jgi:hypothetical protein
VKQGRPLISLAPQTICKVESASVLINLLREQGDIVGNTSAVSQAMTTLRDERPEFVSVKTP